MTTSDAMEVRTVRLVGLPVRLWLATKQHTDELLREFELMSHSDDGEAVPQRLVELVAALRAQYGAGTEEREAPLWAAVDAGAVTIDLEMDVPVAAAASIGVLKDMLEETDEFCRQGEHLLTLATPADEVAFRNWYLDEISAQLSGAAPTPWSDR